MWWSGIGRDGKKKPPLVPVYTSKNLQTELGLNAGHCIILHLILPGQMWAVLGSGVGLSMAHSIARLLLSVAQGCGLDIYRQQMTHLEWYYKYNDIKLLIQVLSGSHMYIYIYIYAKWYNIFHSHFLRMAGHYKFNNSTETVSTGCSFQNYTHLKIPKIWQDWFRRRGSHVCDLYAYIERIHIQWLV